MMALDRRALHAATVAAALTGGVYGWFRYFGQRMGDFGPEPSRWQGVWQHLHVLAAPLLLFMLGVIVRGHLLMKLRAGGREGRRTGLGLGLLIAPMVLSGYGIQVVTDASWHLALAWIHGLSSLLFVAGHLAHLVAIWRYRRMAEEEL
ncbi:MAG TPA: hypothetical protein VFF76_01660 [Holophagaceae bacterium]|jgi:hypothetical protein|nr:hypothetical protein [Holophagaceae bacterium]